LTLFISRCGYAFAALKTDGSIVAWGHSMYGGIGAPIDSGYTKIYSNALAFAALKAQTLSYEHYYPYGGTTLIAGKDKAQVQVQFCLVG
jgi:hypothetical protein